jgi:hypothetical protein
MYDKIIRVLLSNFQAEKSVNCKEREMYNL